MDVVVTGGTGFVGREVVRQLVRTGHRVRTLSRNGGSSAPGVTGFRGSILQPSTATPAFEGAQAVIHLVGIIAELKDQTFSHVHQEGTEAALEAARQAGIQRFVHMSALGTRPNAVSRYHQTKWAAEERVRNSGLAWTVFRPSLIYGPGDGFVNLFDRMARWSPVLPVIGSGMSQVQPVAVEDVARAFTQALIRPECHQRTLDLCGPDALPFRDLLRLILKVSHRHRMVLPMPLPWARLQALIMEWAFPQLLGVASPLTRDQILMLQENNIGDPRPAGLLLDWTPCPLQAGLERMLSPGKSSP